MMARCFAIVPAAGVGRRMGAAIPKQYLPLAGRCVLEHTLERLLAEPRIERIVVALGPEDGWWPGLKLSDPARIRRVNGGTERADSVLNGLRALEGLAGTDDWALVHDAARPCLAAEDLARLFTALADDPLGGLLAVPVRDTMKRAAADGCVEHTVERERLWHALTPQMFRYGRLRDALEAAAAAGAVITDEASAIERAGLRPRLVEGRADNLKITRPEDLALAAFFLAAGRP
ncbi:MAG: 2-C-methyl-D-erythritol 4-phosphate cytidylyltransferase [Proteobacteria bacterium]|nr:2-C-methyl-D-erythritol 4-phosphate cytidylyltransferase [Pseudomonadota bacterium]HMV40236.1 2-C-methyl-D-erythritol 4-phosphate cytidylyltransferase [Plasticicumulans sp.]HNI22840.1 2-C-methyl-D-erythritol 4-phosphate cytidylyltransferase [Plasticicumulans sp.]